MSKGQRILEGIFGVIMDALDSASETRKATNAFNKPREIMLPSSEKAFWNSSRVLVNVNEVSNISTTSKDGTHVLVLEKFDGEVIKISYTWKSNLNTDLRKLLKLRGVHPDHCLDTASSMNFNFR